VAVDPNKRLSRLLDDLQITEIDRPDYDRISALPQTMLEQLASTLVGLPGNFTKHQSHLFSLLLQIRPEAFQPHLAALDRARDPLAHAYRGAGMASVLGFAKALQEASGALDDELAFAARALLKSGQKEALELFAQYARKHCTAEAAAQKAEALALECGYAFQVDSKDPPRALWRDECAAVRVVENDPARSSVSMGGVSPADAHCATCEQPLMRVFYAQRSRMPWPREERNFAVDTCPTCLLANPTYFVRYVKRSNPETISQGKPKKGKKKVAEILEKRPCVLEDAPRKRDPSATGKPGSFSRIGGLPSWRNPPRSISCPECETSMTFVAQTDEVPGHEEAILLAFECLPCAVVATTTES
jgi:hypothetical protein